MIIEGPEGNLNPGGSRLLFIGGPCAIENLDHSIDVGGQISEICKKLDIDYVFKSSFDKDCRSSADSFHGIGLDEGLGILTAVREELAVPVTTDFSLAEWGEEVGKVVDLIQVPAYLCRQTSMLRAAAETGKAVHVKKGQFMSPWNMRNSAEKLKRYGCETSIMTDRGTFLGYEDLVNDLRSIKVMSQFSVAGYDATHSIQQPTSRGNISGGLREFIPSMVRASMAAGAKVLFMEVHDHPNKAKSDPGTVLNLKFLDNILSQARFFFDAHLRAAENFDLEPIRPGD